MFLSPFFDMVTANVSTLDLTKPNNRYPSYVVNTTHRIGNFQECPYCEHYLHIDYFPPYKGMWGNEEDARGPCYDCEDGYKEYVHVQKRFRMREYSRNRRKKDVNFRLGQSLRVRTCQFVSGKIRAGSAVRDLGCTLEELKHHLESQFTEGMAWHNYGKNKGQWSIDHIVPLSAFNLADRQHFLLASHYLNLQPMWHVENMRKGGAKRCFTSASS